MRRLCVGSIIAVLAPLWLTDAAPAQSPPAPTAEIRSEMDAALARKKDRLSVAARAERIASRTRFAALTSAQSVELGRRLFPAVFKPAFIRPLGERRGEQVEEFLSENAARVRHEGEGRRGIVSSPTPLRATTEQGFQAPVDMRLVDAGGTFSPRNPLARLKIDASAAGGVAFPDVGVSVRPVGVSGDQPPAVAGDRLVWTEVQKDTDLVMAPATGGVESFTQIRSAASPESFDFDVIGPQGASLQLPGEPNAAIELARGDEVLLRIARIVAWDADGEPVQATAAVEGTRLTVRVPHRGQDLAYPLVVDPYVYEDFRYWQTNGNIDFDGWGAMLGGPAWSLFTNGHMGRGLYVVNGAGYFNNGDYGLWEFPPYRQSFVYRAEMHLATHQANGTCLVRGLATDFWYSAYGMWPDGSPLGSPTVECNSFSNSTIFYCSAADCGPSGPVGSRAVFEQLMNGTGYRAEGSPSVGFAYLGGALIYESDANSPAVSISPSVNSGWTNAVQTFTVAGTDPGLGMKVLRFDRVDAAGGQLPWTGNRGDAHPCVGERHTRCPDVISYTRNTADLPDGVQTLQTIAEDVVGNQTITKTTVRVDRTPPQTAYLEGTLYEDRDRSIVSGVYDLAVAASDGSDSDKASGIARAELMVDGALRATAVPDAGCAGAQCELDNDDLEVDLSGVTGSHSLSVRVYDVAGNVSTTNWTATLSATSSAYAPRAALSGGDSNGGSTANCESQSRRLRAMASKSSPVQRRRGEWRDHGAGGPEITDTFTGGRYVVTRCGRDDTLVVSQLVAPVPVPGGTEQLRVAQTERRGPGRFGTTTWEYRRPDDPVARRLWADPQVRADAIETTMEPTR